MCDRAPTRHLDSPGRVFCARIFTSRLPIAAFAVSYFFNTPCPLCSASVVSVLKNSRRDAELGSGFGFAVLGIGHGIYNPELRTGKAKPKRSSPCPLCSASELSVLKNLPQRRRDREEQRVVDANFSARNDDPKTRSLLFAPFAGSICSIEENGSKDPLCCESN